MFQYTILAFLVFILINFCSCILPRPHSLEYKEQEFNDLANLIIAQDDVHTMDDFTKDYKQLNEVPIKLKDIGSDEDVQFLSQVEDSLKLDTKIVSALRIKLEDTKLRKFIKSGDTILFIVDGFLDNSWGFMYSKNGLTMDSTSFNFKWNYIRFVEDINKNWKRIAIH